MSNLTTVGVYGTLKEGHGNHVLLSRGNAKKVGEGLVSGHRLFQSGIPFLIKDNSSDYKVLVELYEVDDSTLQSLDRLEGHPSCYCRTVLTVEQSDTTTEAWVYEYPSPQGEENTTGVF